VRSASLPVGSVVTDEGVMPKAEFLRTAFYDECLRPQGPAFPPQPARRPRRARRVANVCVLRSAREGEFGAEDVELLLALAPHLRRAVAVHTRLAEAEGERRALAEALERLPRAAFLVDGAAPCATPTPRAPRCWPRGTAGCAPTPARAGRCGRRGPRRPPS
jgi:hypothetical protein